MPTVGHAQLDDHGAWLGFPQLRDLVMDSSHDGENATARRDQSPFSSDRISATQSELDLFGDELGHPPKIARVYGLEQVQNEPRYE